MQSLAVAISHRTWETTTEAESSSYPAGVVGFGLNSTNTWVNNWNNFALNFIKLSILTRQQPRQRRGER